MKLNLGCANKIFHHWVNIDKVDYLKWAGEHNRPENEIEALKQYFVWTDISTIKAFNDKSCEAIAMVHFLDHFVPKEALWILEQCHRLLAPSGIVRIEVEDLEKIIQVWQSQKLDEWNDQQPEAYRQASNDMRFGMIVFGNMAEDAEYTGHKMIYSANSLWEICKRAGFKHGQVTAAGASRIPEWLPEYDTQPDHSLIMEVSNEALPR
jgi:predicted SAM-dependent methyltransferase